MNKFFDYLEQDMPDFVIRELLHYIRRFTQALAGEIPVEGKMDNYRFCASRRDDGGVQVHWVMGGRQRIAVDAAV